MEKFDRGLIQSFFEKAGAKTQREMFSKKLDSKDAREVDGYVDVIKYLRAYLKKMDFDLGYDGKSNWSRFAFSYAKNMITVGDKEFNIKQLYTTKLTLLDIHSISDRILQIEDGYKPSDIKEEYYTTKKDDATIHGIISLIPYLDKYKEEITDLRGKSRSCKIAVDSWMHEFNARKSNYEYHKAYKQEHKDTTTQLNTIPDLDDEDSVGVSNSNIMKNR